MLGWMDDEALRRTLTQGRDPTADDTDAADVRRDPST